MAKPQNKEELLQSSQEKFEALVALINSYPQNLRNKTFTPNKLMQNIRDIVAHLHHWHILFLGWYKTGMQGKKPEMPYKGYTWSTTPQLNEKIWEKYCNEDLDKVLRLFIKSFGQVYKIIESHSDNELFEKKKYKWTGSTSLGAYLISCTHSHYGWAIKRIKKSLKD